jgi:hypothetical protein
MLFFQCFYTKLRRFMSEADMEIQAVGTKHRWEISVEEASVIPRPEGCNVNVNVRDISDLFSQNHTQHTTHYKTATCFG